ncbi:unnamed protein product [Rotaria magnacalcarata]|uniref:Uncharacterized protein n=1 Tax=Rotaria magnacalcarata TaxID=392030 RepID=A0A819SYA1_9BILA|nr:unnamed protein product [Rotaria magnacalcarata]CAF2141690.1 unnamed protein product [Rotaria magnacalcarata]CAF4063842.1 unnamed protein product [Rotaria magnacalcarata]CAF4163832.1 unnamed protein product [Rotaria magnacalcarata]
MPTIFTVIAVLLLTFDSLHGQDVILEKSPVENIKLPPGPMGLTFGKANHLSTFGIDRVGCSALPGSSGPTCNPYTGDTLCSLLRPVLCVKVDNSPRPPYLVLGTGAAMPAYFYAGWNLGHIATTLPVQGFQFANRAAVNAFCTMYFGSGWVVATFHDGKYIAGMNGTTYSASSWALNAALIQTGGWHYYSYGDVRNDTRFWIHIQGQPANCWNP